MTTRLGFVGLGVMGGQMVKRLLDHRFPVVGHNRTRAKAQWLIDAGMTWADTPRAVAQAADVTFTMVTDTSALDAVTRGADGVLAGLQPGTIYIDLSTVSPAKSRELAAAVAAAGADMLDAPVSGSVITLQEGRLSVMVGGTRDTFDRALPVLQTIGPKVTHVGRNGQAVAMKIATNLNLGAQMLAFCEAVLLAEKSGIARETAVEVLLGSVIASPMLKYRGPFVLQQPAEAWFNVSMMQKDLDLALEMGRNLGVPLPSVVATNELLTSARALGFAEQDYAVLVDVLATMSGMPTAATASAGVPVRAGGGR